MAEKERFLLNDPVNKPDDKLLFSLIGSKIDLWHDILNYAESEFPGSSGSWNFYKDGNQWLFKFVLNKKTLFWAGLLEDTFRVTCYFGDKAEPVILESNLPEPVKNEFKTAKRYGKIRAITMKICDEKDVETVKKVIAIKAKIK